MTTYPLPIGEHRMMQDMAERRTQAQRDAVYAITLLPEFSYLALNPFPEALRPEYVGPFNVHWIDTDGKLHVQRLNKRGQFIPR